MNVLILKFCIHNVRGSTQLLSLANNFRAPTDRFAMNGVLSGLVPSDSFQLASLLRARSEITLQTLSMYCDPVSSVLLNHVHNPGRELHK